MEHNNWKPGNFKKRKKPNYKRALFFILLLLLVLYLYMHVDAFIENLFGGE
jgi:hypothetical protein